MHSMEIKDIETGAEMLHFNPKTGRIIRCVTVVEIKGEAVIVRADNGKNKGETYPVSINALAR